MYNPNISPSVLDKKILESHKRNEDLEQLILKLATSQSNLNSKKLQEEYTSYSVIYEKYISTLNKYDQNDSGNIYERTVNLIQRKNQEIIKAQNEVKYLKELGKAYLAHHQKHALIAQTKNDEYIKSIRKKKLKLQKFKKSHIFPLKTQIESIINNFHMELVSILEMIRIFEKQQKDLNKQFDIFFDSEKDKQEKTIQKLNEDIDQMQKLFDYNINQKESFQSLKEKKLKEARQMIENLLNEHTIQMEKTEKDHQKEIETRRLKREQKNIEKKKLNEKLQKEDEFQHQKAKEDYENAVKEANELQKYRETKFQENDINEKIITLFLKKRIPKFQFNIDSLLNKINDISLVKNHSFTQKIENIGNFQLKTQVQNYSESSDIQINIKIPEGISEFGKAKMEAFSYCSKDELGLFLLSEENLLKWYLRVKLQRERDREKYAKLREENQLALENAKRIHARSLKKN